MIHLFGCMGVLVIGALLALIYWLSKPTKPQPSAINEAITEPVEPKVEAMA